ncbi:MAG: S8 family serine peptidase, partial [Acidimicrobiales bacterium]
MRNAPDTIHVGPDDHQTIYERAESNYLVKLRDGQDAESASATFSDSGLTAPSAHAEAAKPTLQPGGFVWVEADPSFAASGGAEAAESIETRDDVEDVYPVYFAAGQGPSSAASPMVRTILARFEDDSVIGAITELGLVHDEAASRHLTPFHQFSVPTELSVDDALALLPLVQQVPGVEHAEFDWLKLETYTATPNDTHYGSQWNMPVIGLDDGRDVETGSATVWIAVIDSGFDLAHPDLDFTPNVGATATHFDAPTALAGGLPPYNAGSAGVFHGTAVAGIAAANTDNGVGVAGVGGGCRVMPVKLGT